MLAAAGLPAIHAQPLNANKTAAATALPRITLPNQEGTVKVLVFGDTGRGSRDQYDLGRVMFNYHHAFAYDTVLMTGDNIYGTDKAEDMKKKFEDVYKPLVDKGVKFYASLGNHDASNQRFYSLFNMNGNEYYHFKKGDVSFYALNSNYLDKRQLEWMVSEFSTDKSKWRVAFFHHPPYSSGDRHGSDEDVRAVVHQLFKANGVYVVFTGHDHFYERIKPQDGIQYFVAGAGGKIRKGDVNTRKGMTDAYFDTDLSFMLVEFTPDEMYFQVIAKDGSTVDSGVIKRRD